MTDYYLAQNWRKTGAPVSGMRHQNFVRQSVASPYKDSGLAHRPLSAVALRNSNLAHNRRALAHRLVGQP
jgi:hypothetical protein